MPLSLVLVLSRALPDAKERYQIKKEILCVRCL